MVQPFLAGDIPPADSLNLVGAVARRTTTFSVPNDAATDIPLDAEIYDTHGLFTPTAAVMTVPTGIVGLFPVKGWVAWAINGTGFRRLAISLNNGTTGGTDSWHDIRPAVSLGDTAISVTVDLPLTPGATIRLKAWQTSGNSLNVTAARLSIGRFIGS